MRALLLLAIDNTERPYRFDIPTGYRTDRPAALAGCGKRPPKGRFAGGTACATTRNQQLANRGGAGIQPANAFFRILLVFVLHRTNWNKTREIPVRLALYAHAARSRESRAAIEERLKEIR